jgi:hypothetical protein
VQAQMLAGESLPQAAESQPKRVVQQLSEALACRASTVRERMEKSPLWAASTWRMAAPTGQARCLWRAAATPPGRAGKDGSSRSRRLRTRQR